MTKFYRYISEQNYSAEEIEKVKETLKKRCAPFLKEFDAPIFRGYKKGISGIISRKVARKDRKPRFIPKEVHEELDNLLYNMYGWYPRSNGVFTGNKTIAKRFDAKVYMFFPVGKYEYIWTTNLEIYESYDILTNLYKEFSADSSSGLEYDIKQAKANLKDKIKSGIYKSSGLNSVAESSQGYEAIFNCESYYLVDTDLQDKIKEFMKEF